VRFIEAAPRRYSHRVEQARAFYFPVKAEPLRMQPGLFRLGTDFGNAEADRRLFSQDNQLSRYSSEKSRIVQAHPTRIGSALESDADRRALAAASELLSEVLVREQHPAAGASDLTTLSLAVAEDIVVMRRPRTGDGDRVVWANVCFPSGWRPEQILGQSFLGIHARIPAFEAIARAAPSLVEAMVTRPPYVRFVWTISADDALDHHPEQGERAAWSPGTARAFLRVERQTTIGLPSARAAVFLIRTYLYDFEELSPDERATLRRALELMPVELVRYKGLTEALPRALELLR
jgi:hypothetical protein